MTALDETILISARDDVAKFLTLCKAYKSAEEVKAGKRDETPLLALFMAARLDEREKCQAEMDRLGGMVNFTLTDPQRLIRKEDVEETCQTPDMCFEHGNTARCWPCAAKASAMRGVSIDERLPKAPEVARLNRDTERLRALLRPRNFIFKLGDRVRKKTGSSWQGRIVGFYATSLTPDGYAVESEREPGSVQIYPAAALELLEGGAA